MITTQTLRNINLNKNFFNLVLICLLLIPKLAISKDGNFKSKGNIETGINTAYLTSNNTNWFGQYLKGNLQTSASDNWHGEFVNQNAFGENGRFLSIGNVHDFNDSWYTNIDIGGSDHGSFWPQFSVNVSASKKWLTQKQLITTLGFTNHIERKGYKSRVLYTTAAYYFTNPWIVEAGWYYNNSTPGNVKSSSQFLALTQGQDKRHYVTLRYSFGREAYQLLGDNKVISDFYSQGIALIWRQWVNKDWGFNLSTDWYRNPSYIRKGVSIGIFKDF